MTDHWIFTCWTGMAVTFADTALGALAVAEAYAIFPPFKVTPWPMTVLAVVASAVPASKNAARTAVNKIFPVGRVKQVIVAPLLVSVVRLRFSYRFGGI